MDDFLVKMLARVEQQYSDIEKECLMLRKLLRPWPKKKQFSKEKVPEVVKQTEEDEKDRNNDLTPSEKLALEEMDRLLNKAQKAIRIKEKVAMADERSNVTDSNTSCQADNSARATTCTKKNEEDNVTCKKPQNVSNAVTDKCSKVKLVTQRKETLVVKKNPPQTRIASVSSTKETRTSHSVSSSLSSSKCNPPRPSSVASSNSRPSSSRSRYTPAHVNAPFKTDMNTRVPNRKHNHVYKNHLNNKAASRKTTSVAAQKQQPPHLNGLKTLPKISPTVQVQASDTDAFLPGVNDEGTSVISDTNCVREIREIQQEDVAEFTPCDEGDVGHYTKQKDDVCGEPIISVQNQTVVSQDKEQPCVPQGEYFSLKDKRSSIKVPPRFNKLVAENHALLEKCSTAKLVKRMPNTDVAHSFVQRLNEMNKVSEELWTKAKALTCLQSHQLMLNCLNSLDMEALSEATPFQTVYRTKRLLEFILTKFAQTQDESDYFSKVQFRPYQPKGWSSSMSPMDGKDDDIECLFENLGAQSDSDYYMEMLVVIYALMMNAVVAQFVLYLCCGQRDAIIETTRAKLQEDHFVTDALTSSKTWSQLRFQHKLHRIQLHLLSLSEAEWWPVLSENPTNGSVVQMIHSLLTSNGEFFPAIVDNPYS